MRGSLIHVFTGLALGLALAGLLHAPTELVAQQEARTPVVRPNGATAGLWAEEQTVRISPKVERELDRQRARRLSPRAAPPPRRVAPPATSTWVSATVPEPPVATSSEPQPAYAAEEQKAKERLKPKPAKPEKSEPKPEPVAPPAKVVASNPLPAAEPSREEGKKSKKSKKPKKPRKDEHEKSGKSDKEDKDEDTEHGEEQDEHGKHKHGDKN